MSQSKTTQSSSGTPKKSPGRPSGSKNSASKSKSATKADENSVNGKKRASSRPSSPSPKKVKTSPPSSVTSGKSGKKNVGGKSLTNTGKKRALIDLEFTQDECKSNLEKLRRELHKMKMKQQKLSDETVKFPVKDELIPQLDPSGSIKSIPVANIKLNTLLPAESVDEAIAVWDFLNIFSKQLGIKSMEWDNFVDLIQFTQKDSVAFTDIFCSLLQLLLNDDTILKSLSTSMPKNLHITNKTQNSVKPNYSQTNEKVLKSIFGNNYKVKKKNESNNNFTAAKEVEKEIGFSIDEMMGKEELDQGFNGFKVFPKSFMKDIVDPLRLQAVLRCLILRLEPSLILRRSAAEAATALHCVCSHLPTSSNLNLNQSSSTSLHRNMFLRTAIVECLKSLMSLGAGRHCELKNLSIVVNSLLDPASVGLKPLEEEDKLDFGLTKSDLCAMGLPKGVKGKGVDRGNNASLGEIDRDTIFQICGRILSPLVTLYEAAILMERKELFQLSFTHKIRVLKILCDACYDTERIRELLERNADERANKIQQMNKQIREQKMKNKEVSEAKKAEAAKICREENKTQALLEAEQKKLSKTKGKGKTTKKEVEKEVEKNGKKGKKKNESSEVDEVIEVKFTGKSKFDPSMEQLNAKIEEMLLLENLGIQIVTDELTPEPISDDESDEDDEESNSEESENSFLIARRPKRAQQRAQAIEKKKIRQEKIQKNITLEVAYEKLEKGLKSVSDKEIKTIIKQCEKAGLKGKTPQGKVFCTQRLKELYKHLSDLEIQKKDARVAAQHDKTLQELCIRTEPLGEDRDHSLYFAFSGDPRLFVQHRELIPGAKNNSSGLEIPLLLAPTKEEDNLFLNNSTFSEKMDVEPEYQLERLLESRPNRYRYSWSIYSQEELWNLYESLDQRGEREKTLKEKLLARFDITEPPPPVETSGSEFIGRKVVYTLNRKKLDGKVIGWIPDADPIFRIKLENGKEEDMDQDDLENILVDDVIDLCDDDDDDDENDENSSKMDTKSEEEEETEKIPILVKASNGLARTNLTPFWRSQLIQPTMISVRGVGSELFKVMNLLSEGLKRRQVVYSREARTLWENTIRAAEDAKSLRMPLLELEAVVHSTQKGPDVKQHEVESRKRSHQKRKMLKEGWIFADYQKPQQPTSPSKNLIIPPKQPQNPNSPRPQFPINPNYQTQTQMNVPANVMAIAAANSAFYLASQNAGFSLSNAAMDMLKPLNNPEGSSSGNQLQMKKPVIDLSNDSEESSEASDGLKGLNMERGDKKEGLNGFKGEIAESVSVVKKSDGSFKVSDVSVQKSAGEAVKAVAEKIQKNRELEEDKEYAKQFIGLPARRFFKSFGLSDGIIVAFLPGDKNDGITLYRMVHWDGDEEDLETDETIHAVKSFAEDIQENDQDDDDDDGAEEASIGSGESEYKFLDDEDDDDFSDVNEFDENYKNKKNKNRGANKGPTLWPNFETRNRWKATVSNAVTVGEIALSLHCLIQYLKEFGVMAKDPLEEEQRKQLKEERAIRRSERPVKPPPNFNEEQEELLSSEKGKLRSSNRTNTGKNTKIPETLRLSPEKRRSTRTASGRRSVQTSSYSEEVEVEVQTMQRPSRAAARAVRSYAE